MSGDLDLTNEPSEAEQATSDTNLDQSKSVLLKKMLTCQGASNPTDSRDDPAASEKSKSKNLSKMLTRGRDSQSSTDTDGSDESSVKDGGNDTPDESHLHSSAGFAYNTPLSDSQNRASNEKHRGENKSVAAPHATDLKSALKGHTNLNLLHALLKKSAGMQAMIIPTKENAARTKNPSTKNNSKGSESSASVMKRNWEAAQSSWRTGADIWNFQQNDVMDNSIDFNMVDGEQSSRNEMPENSSVVIQESNGLDAMSSPLNKKAKYETQKKSPGTDDSGVYCNPVNKKGLGQLDLSSSDVSSAGASEKQQHGKWKRFVRTAEALQKSGLMDITMKTAELIKQNTLIQREIVMLQKETSDLVRNILNNAENSKVLQALHELMKMKAKSAVK